MSGEEIKIGSNEPKLILNEGEELCEECEGKKVIEVFLNRYEKMKLPCGKCAGTGKVDWIQKATGIHECQEFPEFTDSSSSLSMSSMAFTTRHGFLNQTSLTSSSFLSSLPALNSRISGNPGSSGSSGSQGSSGSIGISGSRGSSILPSGMRNCAIQVNTSNTEDTLCLVLQRLLNMVKSIWEATGYRLMKALKLGIEKILRSFKMVLL